MTYSGAHGQLVACQQEEPILHLPAIWNKLVSRYLCALPFKELLHVSKVLLSEGILDIKLVRCVELHGPVLAILLGIHRAVSLLEVELLRGEDGLH